MVLQRVIGQGVMETGGTFTWRQVGSRTCWDEMVMAGQECYTPDLHEPENPAGWRQPHYETFQSGYG